MTPNQASGAADCACTQVLFVTNFVSHYRVPVFEQLAERHGFRFVLISRGGEEYWQKHLGVSSANIPFKVMAGKAILPKFTLNIPFLIEVFGSPYDVIIKGTNGRFELPVAWLASRFRRRPFILWTGLWEHPTAGIHRFTRPMLRHIYRRANAIVTYGEHVAEYVVKEGAERGKVFVAENAVDNVSFSRPSELETVRGIRVQCASKRGDILLLAVSRLVQQKGLEILIRAVALLESPRPTVAVVGTGPLAQSLVKLAEQLGVRLCLLGGYAAHDMVEAYDAADIFVMPSITTAQVKETWGLACNEAMCRSLPVVATTAVGAAAGGLVVDHVTGLVVPERDAQALSDAIRSLIEDPEKRRILGENGRDRVASTTPEAMVAAFKAAVDYVCGDAG